MKKNRATFLFTLWISLLLQSPAFGQIAPAISREIVSRDTFFVRDSNGKVIRFEIEASFPGNGTGWGEFLAQNLNPMIPVENGAPPGTYMVIIHFAINKQGSVSDLSAVTKHGFGMEEEVIRVLKKSPNWMPAIQDGVPVTAFRKQPISFFVSGKPKKKHRRG